MENRRLILSLLFLCATTAAVAGTIAARDNFGTEPCCFTNPRYTGECTVVPGEGESCSSILAYLNNQASVGKNYCGNTTIRGGWALVDCK